MLQLFCVLLSPHSCACLFFHPYLFVFATVVCFFTNMHLLTTILVFNIIELFVFHSFTHPSIFLIQPCSTNLHLSHLFVPCTLHVHDKGNEHFRLIFTMQRGLALKMRDCGQVEQCNTNIGKPTSQQTTNNLLQIKIQAPKKHKENNFTHIWEIEVFKGHYHLITTN